LVGLGIPACGISFGLNYNWLGRKEIVMFFWLYALIELLAVFLDSGIIPTANVVYPVSVPVLVTEYLIKQLLTLSTVLLNNSISLRLTRDWWPQHIPVFSSMVLWGSNSRKTALLYHFG
jgi:hypothetical protein